MDSTHEVDGGQLGVDASDVAFLACAEDNHTAQQALLLFESLREFGGRLANAALYAFAPRPELRPSARVRDALAALRVTVIDEPLNTDPAHLPQVNKIFACAWAETHLSERVLVFADSDTCFVAEPATLLPEHAAAALCPVWLPGIGAAGPADPADRLWQEAYRICGIDTEARKVRALLTAERIRPYFNTGLIAMRRNAGAFTAWLDNYQRLYRSSRIQHLLTAADAQIGYFKPSFFLEQFSFAVTISALRLEFSLLDPRYNCPFHYRDRLPQQLAWADLSDIIHLHYISYLHWPPFLDAFEPPLHRGGRAFQWLRTRTPLEPLREAQWPPPFLERFAEAMASWRNELQTRG